MTGKISLAPARPARTGTIVQRYVVVDGGVGAHDGAALAGLDPRLVPVDSPRHATLMLVFAPIQEPLLPALVALAAALPAAARVLIVAGPPGAAGADVAAVLPGAYPIAAATPAAIWIALDQPPAAGGVAAPAARQPTVETIRLPGRGEREIATELAVFSLGPIQPFTAGPLRLLLTCDGEQVLEARVEAGYAARGIATAMRGATWRAGADWARLLDPLAPLAGQLAYVQALEQLQGWGAPEPVAAARSAVLAWERGTNGLWWLARFVGLVALARPAETARRLAVTLTALGSALWPQPPTAWIAPQVTVVAAPALLPQLDGLRREVAALGRQLQADRLLGLRTRGIGQLPTDHPAAGVGGPVAQANHAATGDVQSRLDARLIAVTRDLATVEQAMADPSSSGGSGGVPRDGHWTGPAGAARSTVAGPRGPLTLTLRSAGGTGPTAVTWERPSAAWLPLLPALLVGRRLADAEVIVASLDLAMAEADG